MGELRSYGDPCGIARALDRVGERWALLLVRELILGPKRFTDLRAGLPNASPNVLSQRLRELEQTGVVQRRQLEPPANVWVYELSARGRELEPVLFALAQWGSNITPIPEGELSVDALMIALETTFDAAAAGDLRARLELRVGHERFRVTIGRGHFDIERGAAKEPHTVIEGDVASIRDIIFGGRTVANALRSGSVRVEGDRQLATRFAHSFRQPPPS